MNGKSQPKEFKIDGVSTQKKYSCIFFDLDHTLWDYEKNSEETLAELFEGYLLKERGITTFSSFHNHFKRVNTELWHLYDHGKITSEIIREQRFKKILSEFNVHDESLIKDLSHQYLTTCPKKSNVIHGAIETLNYLADSGYELSIITNGFEEIQKMKLACSNLTPFFNYIITSQQAGYKKPAREIFDYAMKLNNVEATNAVMIGDNLLTDIAGARNAGIDTIYFNPDSILHEQNVTIEIQQLSDLCHHL